VPPSKPYALTAFVTLAIAASLDALAPLRALGVEVVVVDGGSRDATVQRARLRADEDGMANFNFAEENKFILAEQRTFLRQVTA